MFVLDYMCGDVYYVSWEEISIIFLSKLSFLAKKWQVWDIVLLIGGNNKVNCV